MFENLEHLVVTSTELKILSEILDLCESKYDLHFSL